VTADSTDDSESSSKNNSNHSSDQHGAAADMQSQFDQVSQQQQLQHKVGISVDASHFFFVTHLTSLVVFFASASI
jgi:alpha/beta superfamily hydrolase